MNFSLPPLRNLGPDGGPDLRSRLRERSARCRDVRLENARFTDVGRSVALRVEGRELLLAPGLGTSERLNAWADRTGEILVRLEGDRVRGLLPGTSRVLDTLELVDELVARVKGLPVEPKLEHGEEEDGELHLTLVAPELAGEVNEGDFIYGGFYLAHSETTAADTEASVRIYRVACRNGALMDCAEGQRLVLPRILAKGEPDPYADWRERLGRVLARSFDGGTVDEEARRFRATVAQVLATPYELLLNLVAQGVISEEESARIQREFNEGRDDSMFALVNAVTYQAHGLRERSEWGRAFALERLGGEILRGDHQPPVLEPVFA